MNTTEQITQLHEQITASMCDAINLSLATGDWQMPWHAGAQVWSSRNPVTDRRYTAGNRMNLGIIASMTLNYGAEWATFKQWQSMSVHTDECKDRGKPTRELCEQGGCELVHVTKGESGWMALRPLLRKEIGDDGVERNKLVGWRAYTVFNSAQVTGYTETYETVEHPQSRLDQLDEAVVYADRCGAQVMHDEYSGASYVPDGDYIRMPTWTRWEDVDAYWSRWCTS